VAEFEGGIPSGVQNDAPLPEVGLARRVLNVRTIGSIVFGIVLIALLVKVVGANLDETVRVISHANPLFLLFAFVAYYLTFPLRGFRWHFILKRVGTELPLKPATEILFLSWFVNCVVPAKLGDIYRAYLLKGNYGASISRTVGTIFIERIADIMVIFGLALAAGFWSFRGRNRPEVDALFLFGFIFAMVLLVLVVLLRYHGQRLTRFLPARIGDLYERFHEGSTGALTAGSVPTIVLVTIGIWLLEGTRLYFVIHALDLSSVGLGISSSVFVALGASLLTAIPLTPGGIGFVQAGVVGMLGLYGVGGAAGLAVAATDWGISIFSVIVIGGIYYAFSSKVRRAHGIAPRRPVLDR
jgi:uncharacterized protein (TIRG00374 family)